MPLEIAARLAGRRGRVLLHSGRDDDGCGACSFVACEPVRTMAVLGESIVLHDRRGDVEERRSGDALALIEELVAEHGAGWPSDLAGPVPVAIGYLGYELGEAIEGRHLSARAAGDPPDLWLGFYDAIWRFDERSQSAALLGRTPAARRALAGAIEAGPGAIMPAPVLGELGPCESDGAYEGRVARILEYIRAGDVYQVNLARCLAAPVLAPGDPLALYAALDRVAPAPYGAVLSAGDIDLVSGSPERFLYRAPGSARLDTRPIKGTRRRTGSPERDRELARELSGDDKERAEHLMIVDLERNDLGKIARLGSVRVDELGYVVELPHLFHMVSRVSCEPGPGVGVAETLRATFPGGSITGAPKRRAREIIAELEGARRGPYTGAIGYFGLRQAMDLSVAIRTAVLSPRELVLHVGGGIVGDSCAAREREETEEKAAGWRRALSPREIPPR